jgi:hypothetical protein
MRIRGVDVAFGGGDDAIAVGVDDGDGGLVTLEQAPGQVVLSRFEGRQPLEGIVGRLTVPQAINVKRVRLPPACRTTSQSARADRGSDRATRFPSDFGGPYWSSCFPTWD